MMPPDYALFLLRYGDRYDDERERLVALVRGPRSADLGALAQVFGPLYDHGDLLVQARCVHLRGSEPCLHEQERAAIRAWRREQGWPDDDDAGAFVVWLCKEHDFTALDYRSVHLDDWLPVEGVSAHIRVTYDRSYNGPGGDDYATSPQKGLLQTAYMPTRYLSYWVGRSMEQQIRTWLHNTQAVSEGNLVGYDLQTLYDKDGHPLEEGR